MCAPGVVRPPTPGPAPDPHGPRTRTVPLCRSSDYLISVIGRDLPFAYNCERNKTFEAKVLHDLRCGTWKGQPCQHLQFPSGAGCACSAPCCSSPWAQRLKFARAFAAQATPPRTRNGPRIGQMALSTMVCSAELAKFKTRITPPRSGLGRAKAIKPRHRSPAPPTASTP